MRSPRGRPLAPIERAVILLRHIYRHPPREVQAVLGDLDWPSSGMTVWRAEQRALAELRELAREAGEPYRRGWALAFLLVSGTRTKRLASM